MLPKRSLTILFLIVATVTLIGMGFRFAVAQFTEPTTTPPGDNPLPLWVQIGNTMYTTHSGNVGIGTTGPVGKLDVRGGVLVAGYAGGQIQITGGSVDGGLWTGATDVLKIANWSDSSKGMAINLTSGNVGIGTTNPAIKLAIGDTDTGLHWNSDGDLAVYTNNAERIRVNALGNVGIMGNVGIGTLSPTSALHVRSGIANAGINIENTGSGGRTYHILSTGGSAPYGSGRLLIGDTAYETIIINQGKVGISMQPDSTPGTNFSVFGNARVYGIVQDNGWRLLARGRHSTEAQRYYLTSSGVTTAHFGCAGCENDFNVDTQIYSWPVNLMVREIRWSVKNTTDDACVGDRTCNHVWYEWNNTWHNHGVTVQDDWIQMWINGTARTNCPGNIPGWSDAGYVNGGFAGLRMSATCTYGLNASLSEIRIDEQDYSPSHSAWEWEIWWR